MSYNLFLLLNANHEKEGLLKYLERRLEQTGPSSFCFDQSPESFFSVEYLQEGKDTSLAIDIPFGGEEAVVKDVLDFMTYLESYIQFQVLDPQIGRLTDSSDAPEILKKWKSSNAEALANYSDGHYFVRTIAERDGKKSMVEAIRFQEETWQNHCSVALAYNRVQNAEKALHHFQRAFELDPENIEILHAIGVTQFNLQNYANARDTILEYLRHNPDHEDAKEILRASEAKLNSQGI
jgi:tetratricopeptide (TPR) repeat protein